MRFLVFWMRSFPVCPRSGLGAESARKTRGIDIAFPFRLGERGCLPVGLEVEVEVEVTVGVKRCRTGPGGEVSRAARSLLTSIVTYIASYQRTVTIDGLGWLSSVIYFEDGNIQASLAAKSTSGHEPNLRYLHGCCFLCLFSSFFRVRCGRHARDRWTDSSSSSSPSSSSDGWMAKATPHCVHSVYMDSLFRNGSSRCSIYGLAGHRGFMSLSLPLPKRQLRHPCFEPARIAQLAQQWEPCASFSLHSDSVPYRFPVVSSSIEEKKSYPGTYILTFGTSRLSSRFLLVAGTPSNPSSIPPQRLSWLGPWRFV